MKIAKRIVVWGALIMVVALLESCPANSLLTSIQQKVSEAQAGVPVTGVGLNPTSLNLMVGGATGTVTATITPANATNKDVIWSSSATGVATVSGGVVTPVSVGTATITVTTVDGNKTATCLVTVGTTNVAVTGVSLSNLTMGLVAGGATGNLVATIAPANATNQNVSWTSDNPAASVNATGLTAVVTPVAVGTAHVKVTTVDGGYTATCTVTVGTTNVPVTGVSLSQSSLQLTVGAGTGTLVATISPSGATNQNVTWSSDNTIVATVSGSDLSGVVSPASGGTANITVTTKDGNYKATCLVTVIAHVTGVSLPATLNITMSGGAATLTPTFSPPSATNKNVTWASDNTAVATVSSSGVVTPVSSGGGGWTANITVTTQDGNYSATCSVSVAYAIGSTGLAGGIIMYDSVADSGSTFSESGVTCRYLEVAPSDQSTGIQWYNGTNLNITEADASIGMGKANTAAIIAAQGSGSYAAELCAGLNIGGHTDWFLPSSFELSAIWQNWTATNSGGFAAGAYYWSSSQTPLYPLQPVMACFFVAGMSGGLTHQAASSSYYVRAVRAF